MGKGTQMVNGGQAERGQGQQSDHGKQAGMGRVSTMDHEGQEGGQEHAHGLGNGRRSRDSKLNVEGRPTGVGVAQQTTDGR